MIKIINEEVLFVKKKERKNPVIFKKIKKIDLFNAILELAGDSGLDPNNLPPF